MDESSAPVLRLINCLPGYAVNEALLGQSLDGKIEFAAAEGAENLTRLLDKDKLNLLLLDKPQFNRFPSDTTSFYRVRFFLKAAPEEVSADLMDYELIDRWFKDTPDDKELAFALLKARADLGLRRELSRLQKQSYLHQKNLAELNKIGAALNSERNIDKLLNLILTQCMEITASDAGSLYLVVEEKRSLAATGEPPTEKRLRFKIAKNQSREVAFTEFTMDISNKSIAGSVALSGETLNIEDAYRLPAGATYTLNKSYDESSGYRTQSVLTVPMKNTHDAMIGLIQLINKKSNARVKLQGEADMEKYVRPFSKNDEALAFSLASQAAVALDNARLYQNITSLFEGFIRASVTAIESRDPTTGGHSERVATLSVATAELINKVQTGKLAKVRFSGEQLRELKYAGLLHDFGKIGVREQVLIKAKKLYGHELDVISARYEFIKKCIELEFSRRKNDFLLAYGNQAAREHMDNLDAEMRARIDEINRYFEFVLKANEPTVLEAGGFEKIQEIGQKTYHHKGARIDLLSPKEIQRLSIKRGSLSEDERLEIESHVTHSFNFLSKIPWTDDLRAVPEIAYGHHEKLDGSGYPRQIREAEIPVQAKIMTVADIFDALTASDRPYKKAMPAERALTILEDEVKHNKLDGDIFKLFAEARVYQAII